eukprot:s1292_g4.t1
MSKTAVEALQRAAERSKRRAELEVAKMVIERHLGYEIAETQFAWLSVLSMPQLLADRLASEESKKPKIASKASGGGGGGDGSPRGYEAHKASESARPDPPQISTRPKLVRVNSVPVLAAPVTPVSQIRRNGSVASLQSQGGGTTTTGTSPDAPAPGDDAMGDQSNGLEAKEPTKTKKMKRKRKGKKGARLAENNDDHENAGHVYEETQPVDESSKTEDVQERKQEHEGNTAPTGAAMAPEQKAQAPISQPHSGPSPAGEATTAAPRPAAAKTKAAKAKHEPPTENMNQKANALASKPEPNPELDQQMAAQDNLRRANTAMQKTPVQNEHDQNEGSKENHEKEKEKDVEELLEKEMKQEPKDDTRPSTQPSAAAPAEKDPPSVASAGQPTTQAPAATEVSQGEKPAQVQGKRVKTDAQKAAHARYMRFSRSFTRNST